MAGGFARARVAVADVIGKNMKGKNIKPPKEVTSVVTKVKWHYRKGSPRQRAAIRAWMRTVLSDEDGRR